MIEHLMNEYGYRESGTDDLLMPHVLTDSNSVGYGGGVESLTEGSWPFDQTSEPNGSTPMATLDAESYYPEKPKRPNYFRLTAMEDGCKVQFYNSFSAVENLFYSLDNGRTWNVYESTEYSFPKIELEHSGDYILLKGISPTDFCIVCEGKIAASGDINTLYDGIGGMLSVSAWGYSIFSCEYGQSVYDVSGLVVPCDNEHYVGLGFQRYQPNYYVPVMSKDGKNFIFDCNLTAPIEVWEETYESLADLALNLWGNGRGFDSVATAFITTNNLGSIYVPNVDSTHPGQYDVSSGSAECVINAIAGEYVQFVKWQSSEDGVTWADIPGATESAYTLTMTHGGDYYIKAVFQEVSYKDVPISASVSPEGSGTVNVPSTVRVERDGSATVSLSATPNEGYEFVKWIRWYFGYSSDIATTAECTDTINSETQSATYQAIFQTTA